MGIAEMFGNDTVHETVSISSLSLKLTLADKIRRDFRNPVLIPHISDDTELCLGRFWV